MSDTDTDTATRVENSNDILGHQHYRAGPDEFREQNRDKLPVEEGVHFKSLAHTHWSDYLVPTVVKWAHGEVDSFSDAEVSRENRRKAKEAVESGEGEL